MYHDAKAELWHILFIIAVVFFASGFHGLVNLGKGVLFNIGVILQIVPFFKWEILIAVFKILLRIFI